MNLPAVAIEASHPDFWHKYVGRNGMVIGMATFGESAPAKDLYKHFGITADRVVTAVHLLVNRSRTATVQVQGQELPAHILASSN